MCQPCKRSEYSLIYKQFAVQLWKVQLTKWQHSMSYSDWQMVGYFVFHSYFIHGNTVYQFSFSLYSRYSFTLLLCFMPTLDIYEDDVASFSSWWGPPSIQSNLILQIPRTSIIICFIGWIFLKSWWETEQYCSINLEQGYFNHHCPFPSLPYSPRKEGFICLWWPDQ